MGRDYREESWWPQPLLDRWYLTDAGSFEIPDKSVQEAEKSRPQKIDLLGSGAWLNPWDLLSCHKVQVLNGQNWKLFGPCEALLLRMEQSHKGQAWIYICSVLLLLYI